MVEHALSIGEMSVRYHVVAVSLSCRYRVVIDSLSCRCRVFIVLACCLVTACWSAFGC